MKQYFLLPVLMVITACVHVPPPVSKSMPIHSNSILTSTAALSHSLVRNYQDKHIICTQTSPDAAYQQDNSFSFSFAIVNTGDSESGGDEEGTEEVEMAGRTPALMMSRELFYRTCEFASNYNLNKAEAKELFNRSLDMIAEAWAVEAGNTTVTVGDSVSNSATISLKEARVASTALEEGGATISSDDDDDDDDDD